MNTLRLSSSFVRSILALGLTVTGIVACSVSGEPTGSTTQNDTANTPPAPGTGTPAPGPQCNASQGDQACVMCCAGDGPVKQVVQTAVQCLTACGEQDSACQDACYQAYETACQPLGDACSTFENCAEASCQDPCSGDDDDSTGDDDDSAGGDDDDNGSRSRSVFKTTAKSVNGNSSGGNGSSGGNSSGGNGSSGGNCGSRTKR